MSNRLAELSLEAHQGNKGVRNAGIMSLLGKAYFVDR